MSKKSSVPHVIECVDAGIISYEQGINWQKRLAESRRSSQIPDHLILLEHPPVITFGRREAGQDLLVSEEVLENNGVRLFKTDRGGRATYHGPGQLVGYFVFELRDSIPDFVFKVEEVLIRVLEHFKLVGSRKKGFPGIWMQEKKVAALGFHVDRKITTHGFSLNVSCDLRPFRYINPCGLADCEMTSMDKELGWHPPLRDVKQQLLQELSGVFKASVEVVGTFPTLPE